MRRWVRGAVWLCGACLLASSQLVLSTGAVAAPQRNGATIWFTDLAGRRIDHATFGQRIRIVTNRGVVCVRTSSGSAGNYCSHFTPRSLRRRVNPRIVFGGFIRATSYDARSSFASPRVLARATLPVR